MITNELSDAELVELLRPFLRLRPQEDRDNVLRQVLQYQFQSYEDLKHQKRVRFTYAGFDVQFFVSENELNVVFFKKCWFPNRFKSKGPICKLLDICKRELHGVQFERLDIHADFPAVGNAWFTERKPMLLYVDPRNADLNRVKANPLLHAAGTVICFFERGGTAQVELCFKTWGYCRIDGRTLAL